MKKPVLDLKDYIEWLKISRENFAKEMPTILTPDQIKSKTLQAVTGTPGDGLTSFKEIMDSLKKESFIKGQLAILDHLIIVAEQQVKNYEDKTNGTDE